MQQAYKLPIGTNIDNVRLIKGTGAVFFNPFQDINNDWFLSVEELNNTEFTEVKALNQTLVDNIVLTDYHPKPNKPI